MRLQKGQLTFSSFFRGLVGFGQVKHYQPGTSRKFFAPAMNILMQYRLCDILTWIFHQDLSGVVPMHGKKPIKVPETTVRFLFALTVNPDFPKFFASMLSITHVINGAADLFTKTKGKEVERIDTQPDGNLSDGLNKLWRRFGMFSDRATAANICQNLVLVAYHLRCLLEVGLFASVILLSHNGNPGSWGHQNPNRNTKEGPLPIACPSLSISFCVSPDHSLWDCLAHERGHQ